MPANELNVNLLEHDTLEESPIGRIITWATAYGRYIMITTEVVVLLAFISRFSLDRKRADLDDAINSKKAIIEANAPFETQVREIQEELAKIKTITESQKKSLETLQIMKSILPSDVYLESYNYTENNLTIKAVASTTQGFMMFMNNLSGTKSFYRTEVGEIKKNPTTGISFQFTVSLTPEKKPVKTVQKAEEEKQSY